MEAFGKAPARSPRQRWPNALAGATATLAPVLARVAALEEEDRRAFRTGLFRFVRLYNFITQIAACSTRICTSTPFSPNSWPPPCPPKTTVWSTSTGR